MRLPEDAAVENEDQSALVTVYFGHAPNPASGNTFLIELGLIHITDVSPIEFARCNATLGKGFASLFSEAILKISEKENTVLAWDYVKKHASQ